MALQLRRQARRLRARAPCACVPCVQACACLFIEHFDDIFRTRRVRRAVACVGRTRLCGRASEGVRTRGFSCVLASARARDTANACLADEVLVRAAPRLLEPAVALYPPVPPRSPL